MFEPQAMLPGVTSRQDAGRLQEGIYHVDYNDDGLLDLFYRSDHKFHVYTAQRTAVGTIEYSYAADPVGVLPQLDNAGEFENIDFRWTDCNLDGALDYYFTDHTNQAACALYINNGDGTFRRSAPYVDNDCGSAEFVDINADGVSAFAFSVFLFLRSLVQRLWI